MTREVRIKNWLNEVEKVVKITLEMTQQDLKE